MSVLHAMCGELDLSLVVVIFRDDVVGNHDSDVHSSVVQRQQLVTQAIICHLVHG